MSTITVSAMATQISPDLRRVTGLRKKLINSKNYITRKYLSYKNSRRASEQVAPNYPVVIREEGVMLNNSYGSLSDEVVECEHCEDSEEIHSSSASSWPEPTIPSLISDEVTSTESVKDPLDDYFVYFRRSALNKTVNKKNVKFCSKLTYFLRCKHFMKLRDPSLINTLVNDARVWMLKEGRKCDTEDDYFMLAHSVMATFLVNTKEMEFRKHLKNKMNWDNMAHLNKTLLGDLGKVPFLYKENTLLGSFLPSQKFPAKSLQV